MKQKLHLILFATIGTIVLQLASCADRTPMVKTTTRSAGGIARLTGAIAGDPGATTTTTEAPFESETHKSFGRAAENLFAR